MIGLERRNRCVEEVTGQSCREIELYRATCQATLREDAPETRHPDPYTKRLGIEDGVLEVDGIS